MAKSTDPNYRPCIVDRHGRGLPNHIERQVIEYWAGRSTGISNQIIGNPMAALGSPSRMDIYPDNREAQRREYLLAAARSGDGEALQHYEEKDLLWAVDYLYDKKEPIIADFVQTHLDLKILGATLVLTEPQVAEFTVTEVEIGWDILICFLVFMLCCMAAWLIVQIIF